MLSALVVVPTYRERENLEGVVSRILAADPRLSVLVVDDNSPDGTGQLADILASADHRVTVLHRSEKAGLGTAYVAGFREAIARGVDYVLEIDADGSHRPEELPLILAALDAGAAMAIGTRWMPGGSVENWPRRRQLISRAGTGYARLVLGSTLRDITSGFRGFRRDALERIDLGSARSHGYSFQIELAWLIERSGAAIAEVPITFVERTKGASKMSAGIIAEAMWRVTVWGFLRRRHSAPGPRIVRE